MSVRKVVDDDDRLALCVSKEALQRIVCPDSVAVVVFASSSLTSRSRSKKRGLFMYIYSLLLENVGCC